VKVYLDENLSPVIAGLLRNQGIDATTAQEVGNVQLGERVQLAYAARAVRASVISNVIDFIALAHGAIATNTGHAGIVLVPSRFRGDEFQAIADAIFQALKPYRGGLHGLVLYLRRE